MRFTLALLSLASSALASSLVARASSGLTTDVCADVSFDLKVPDLFHPGKTINCGGIKTCICKSDLNSFCGLNPVTIIASALIGKAKVIDIISDLIDKSADHQTCHYPQHALPICKPGNPCHFNCKDGYTPYPASKPTQCICKAPLKDCNGKCGLYHSCPSGKVKRDALLPRDRSCTHGLTACGVMGGRSSAWECVDTMSDLESCGGCIIPMSHSSSKATGVDCSAIRGVSDVSCVNSQCVVHRCRSGYELSRDRSTCEYTEAKDPVLLAAEYGLEHIPFFQN